MRISSSLQIGIDVRHGRTQRRDQRQRIPGRANREVIQHLDRRTGVVEAAGERRIADAQSRGRAPRRRSRAMVASGRTDARLSMRIRRPIGLRPPRNLRTNGSLTTATGAAPARKSSAVNRRPASGASADRFEIAVGHGMPWRRLWPRGGLRRQSVQQPSAAAADTGAAAAGRRRPRSRRAAPLPRRPSCRAFRARHPAQMRGQHLALRQRRNIVDDTTSNARAIVTAPFNSATESAISTTSSDGADPAEPAGRKAAARLAAC